MIYLNTELQLYNKHTRGRGKNRFQIIIINFYNFRIFRGTQYIFKFNIAFSQEYTMKIILKYLLNYYVENQVLGVIEERYSFLNIWNTTFQFQFYFLPFLNPFACKKLSFVKLSITV